MARNVDPVDGFTPIHAILSALAGASGISRVLAYSAIVATELVEKFVLEPDIIEAESAANRVVDLVVSVVAYELGWSRRK